MKVKSHRKPKVKVRKANREIFGTDFPLGREWDAGVTPPNYKRQGRWTVIRNAWEFRVIFYSFLNGTNEILETFPPTWFTK